MQIQRKCIGLKKCRIAQPHQVTQMAALGAEKAHRVRHEVVNLLFTQAPMMSLGFDNHAHAIQSSALW